MNDTRQVHRPLENAFSLFTAVVLLLVLLAGLRWVFSGDAHPFDGQLLSALGGLLVVVLWGLLVAAIVIAGIFVAFAVFAGLTGKQWATMIPDLTTWGAVGELKARYAGGKITREEYLRILDDLNATRKAGPR